MALYLFHASIIMLMAAIIWRYIAVIKAAAINVANPGKNDLYCSPVIIAHFGILMPAFAFFCFSAVIYHIYG